MTTIEFDESRGVSGPISIAPAGTPLELLERAAALVIAGENLGISEKVIRVTPAYREVSLRIRWWPIARLTERTAQIIVAATS